MCLCKILIWSCRPEHRCCSKKRWSSRRWYILRDTIWKYFTQGWTPKVGHFRCECATEASRRCRVGVCNHAYGNDALNVAQTHGHHSHSPFLGVAAQPDSPVPTLTLWSFNKLTKDASTFVSLSMWRAVGRMLYHIYQERIELNAQGNLLNTHEVIISIQCTTSSCCVLLQIKTYNVMDVIIACIYLLLIRWLQHLFIISSWWAFIYNFISIRIFARLHIYAYIIYIRIFEYVINFDVDQIKLVFVRSFTACGFLTHSYIWWSDRSNDPI